VDHLEVRVTHRLTNFGRAEERTIIWLVFDVHDVVIQDPRLAGTMRCFLAVSMKNPRTPSRARKKS
jgi:hypothetical protein